MAHDMTETLVQQVKRDFVDIFFALLSAGFFMVGETVLPTFGYPIISFLQCPGSRALLLEVCIIHVQLPQAKINVPHASGDAALW